MDSDGYGYQPDDRGIKRLLEDLRTLSPAGVERVARGWERYGAPAHEKFQEAEKTALAAIEKADQGMAWEAVRRQILELTEGTGSLVAWKAEHGEKGHHAEAATVAAALALHGGSRLDPEHKATLLRPMAEALPWLNSEADRTQ